MLHSDQDKWRASRGGYGPVAGIGEHSGMLRELAREVEEAQRRQGETLAHIVDRLRALDATRADSARPDTPAAPTARATLDGAGDEPWDPASAEALMQTCEANESAPRSSLFGASMFGQHQEWVGDRFNDVTQRIKRAIGDLKPGSTVALLEQRLDQFQRHIGLALEDVVRRSDLDGLRVIDAHVNDLGDKLDALERHVARLDTIEADVRSVMEQVSDERIARLLDYDSRFAADLEAVAVRAAEEVHARLGQDDERVRADARRHEELRALIETSIQDRRQVEADAASLVSGLSGRVDAQADRYDDIKTLLEHAIQEQRQSEQTALGMLDTLQQALVRVLDRMDSLEQQHLGGARGAGAGHPAEQPHAEDVVVAFAGAEAAPRFAADPFVGAAAAPAYADAPADAYGMHGEMAAAPPAPVEGAAAYGDSARTGSLVPHGGDNAVDRIRRDFVADARRAKLKAAANRAEAVSDKVEPPKRTTIETARAALTQAARLPTAGGAGRFFGASPKLLAGVLALVVAINGGLLLFSKDDKPAVPQITIQEGPAAGPADANGEAAPDAPAPSPGPRSELDDDGEGFAHATPTLDTLPAPTLDGPMLTPSGFMDDVLAPSAVDADHSGAPAAVPRGMTIASSGRELPDAAVADLYEQQVLASLSGKLGTIAAEHSPGDLLPEKNGRIDTAYTGLDMLPPSRDTAGQASALDLPPATVGPLSLRLAAANGDASAEFEVAARLAEGKGTNQNFGEALRWYQRSATKGFAQAQYRLGTLYERGLGVPKDVNRARVWYSRAAEQGNVKSMHNLAVLSAGGETGEPDYAAATKWFIQAAEHGLADSQYNLAVLLENGLGMKANRVAAMKWYALAAESGDADAVQRRDALKSGLSAADLKAAEKLIADFKPRRAAPLANDARAAGEDWKKRVDADTNG